MCLFLVTMHDIFTHLSRTCQVYKVTGDWQMNSRDMNAKFMFLFVNRADAASHDGGGQKTSRLNGFLNLKTPLISTKTLG